MDKNYKSILKSAIELYKNPRMRKLMGKYWLKQVKKHYENI
jgi:hypothetical protein